MNNILSNMQKRISLNMDDNVGCSPTFISPRVREGIIPAISSDGNDPHGRSLQGCLSYEECNCEYLYLFQNIIVYNFESFLFG